MVVSGTDLPATSRHNRYAFWLVDGSQKRLFLGFDATPVASNRKLVVEGLLSKDCFRYHRLLVTLQAKRGWPAKIVLDGPFHR